METEMNNLLFWSRTSLGYVSPPLNPACCQATDQKGRDAE